MTTTPNRTRLIARLVLEHIGEQPIADRIEIYQGLAEILPTDPECEAAQNVAERLMQAERAQGDFSQLLLSATN